MGRDGYRDQIVIYDVGVSIYSSTVMEHKCTVLCIPVFKLVCFFYNSFSFTC